MAVSPLFSVLKNQDPRAFFQISGDWKALLRLHFLHAALDSRLLHALSEPRTRQELLDELEAERPELLDAILGLGTSLGELSLSGGRYRVKGSRSRALQEKRNDALAAMVEANVTYYNDAFRGFSQRLRGGPLSPGVGAIGPLVARASKIAEPYIEDFLRKEVRGKGPIRVLDVGCGSGVNLRATVDENPQARGVGLELDPDVVRQGRENLTAWNLDGRVAILQGDIRSAPEEVRGAFDLVLLLNVIYYFPVADRVALLRSLRQRLSPGGALLIVTGCGGDGMDLFSANLNLATSSMEGLTPLPNADEMEAQLLEAGFHSAVRRRLVARTTFFGFIAS